MVEKKDFNNSESLKNNKKLRVFLLFLFLSILFWSLIKLQKEYITDIEFELAYSDVPKNKLIQNRPETKVKLTLKTTGFKLLNYGFKEKTLDYSLTEVERKEGTLFFSETRSNLNFLQAQLSAETVVLNAVSGNGTKNNPYILEDLEITVSSGYPCAIRKTDAYWSRRLPSTTG